MSALEFYSRPGAVLAKFFNTTTTEICCIKKGERHLEFKNVYDNLDIDERRRIYKDFCEKYNFIEIKKNTTISKSKRKLSCKQVLYCLSVLEFEDRKNAYISNFLNVDRNTIRTIVIGKSYQDYKLIYDKLDKYAKENLHRHALKYFGI